MAENEDGRLLALQDYDIDNIGRSGIFDALLELATELSGVPGAALNMMDATRQINLASFNLNVPVSVARKDTFCTSVIEKDDIVEICDASGDPCYSSNPFVVGAAGLRYYAGFPVRSPAGFVLGALCLLDNVPHRLDELQKKHLLKLASIASQLLEVHRAEYRRRRIAALLKSHSSVLHQTALGAPLHDLTEQLIGSLESQLPGTRASLMGADATGALRWLAGPSLPAALADRCARLEPSSAGLPCPAAALGGQPILCTDIAADPIWAIRAAFLVEFGIAAFWSIPLLATDGRLVGTLALYFDHPHVPSDDERGLVDLIVASTAIVIERNAATQCLLESERQLKEAQEIAGLGAYSVSPDRSVRMGSAIAQKILGLPPVATVIPTEQYNSMIHPDDLLAVLAFRKELESSDAPLKITYRIIRANDGAVRWVEGHCMQMRDDDGNVLRCTGVIQDVTERRVAEQALRLNQRAVESSSTAIVIVDAINADMPVIYANPAFENMTGYALDEIVGRNLRILQGTKLIQPGRRELRHAIDNRQDGHALLHNFRKDGSDYWAEVSIAPVRDELGVVTHYVGFQNDCTDRIRYQNELAHQAGHDSLTGLANRNLLQDRLEQAILRSQAAVAADATTPVCHAVTFIDLDHFKLINDSLGHAAGDLLLKECARRLCATVQQSDTVARMGGDEFVILLHDIADETAALRQIDAVLATLREPFLIDGQVMSVTASAGVALYPIHGETTSALLRHADIAMYAAKSNGRAGSRTFSDALRVRVTDSMQLKNELVTALSEKQFCLHYQPKINATTGVLVGFEALVRWNHPSRGLLYPGSFIDAAERFGLIYDLGAWVMEEACRQTAVWQRERRYKVSVAVNVSALQFRNVNFLSDVERILGSIDLNPKFLELEITESLVMESPEQFIHLLAKLHRLGVTISVDDFGTGYSSLSFVKQFPIDYLKIDRSFVNDITTDPSDAAICNTIITMAHNLGLLVVAEGVETEAQATFLREHGCDILQGFLISKPLPADADFGSFPRQIGY